MRQQSQGHLSILFKTSYFLNIKLLKMTWYLLLGNPIFKSGKWNRKIDITMYNEHLLIYCFICMTFDGVFKLTVEILIHLPIFCGPKPLSKASSHSYNPANVSLLTTCAIAPKPWTLRSEDQTIGNSWISANLH